MTKELVLIGHGKMAEEVKKSAELIMGPQEHIHVVCLLQEEGPEDFEKKFQDTINGIPEEDLTVFSDLMGGTPANTVSRLIMGGQNIHLVAGMNLVMVIDWLNSQMIGNDSDAVNAGKAGIVDINQMLASMKK
ncbi:phosphotransferase system, mannose fructose-specific component IIA [Lactobacillus taiwanensis DSM 21401]|uniref:PTS sugar transporter subunit IIA n=1 Tax=Lactobacillus taiwanensis TaxID=508451 RepID=UPI0006F12B57|nr:PTS sugar transporter subunit IIA [Lactobacillus taiwanensis]KRN00905.1 phosphotransferase system, mannose fructose-specific component IIA [Lactobacillus taiwanensis DSM 21401]MCR1915775.1 PTS sugar transporter subunit IIA [Lactobacillus taiwanensis]OYR96562.1 PTS fructose transporter subunit IIA [Lactobacillus taiwanensis]OYS01281.1 PTS fructose transporter subunit IIA [Lactobacillus taiwanensis]OYS12139.1 PTS fructose transporter subunit IIA [Lactobacillus taiwanensis]